MRLDFSKNLIDEAALHCLLQLTEAVNLNDHINALFSGEIVNISEQRPALHTALRNHEADSLLLNGENIMLHIRATFSKMGQLVDNIHQQKQLGATGKPINTIVNIGIGGSDLGPALVCDALHQYSKENIKVLFVSNIDPYSIEQTLQSIDEERTLFIVASKSFTTQETLTNANTAKQWLVQKLGEYATRQHFIAVTAKPEIAIQFGIDPEKIFPMWDWVGGRYSLWSAIGLPIAILLGMEQFYQLLAGARAMDIHFQQTEFSKNMPVLLALIGIWHVNIGQAQTHGIIPYTERLRYLSAYIQQLDMESNGKSVDQQGNKIEHATAPIVWGAIGTNSQHACHQLLHQGAHIAPVDFILPIENASNPQQHQTILYAHCLAQAKALMEGKTEQQAYAALIAQGVDEIMAKQLAKHKVIAGNKPKQFDHTAQINSLHFRCFNCTL